MLDVSLQFLDLLIEVLDGLVTQLHLHGLLLQVLHQLLVFIEIVFLLLPHIPVLLLGRRRPLILFGPLVLIENLLSIEVVGREVPPCSLVRLLLQVAKSDSRFFIIHQRTQYITIRMVAPKGGKRLQVCIQKEKCRSEDLIEQFENVPVGLWSCARGWLHADGTQRLFLQGLYHAVNLKIARLS